jgi:vacuolar-type H+-ATPase subunit I/STV1
MKHFWFIAVVLLLPLAGCSPPAGTSGQQTLADSGRATTAEYRDHVQQELDRMNAQLQQLKERAAAAGAETRAKLQPQIDQLERDMAATRSRLAQLGQQGAEAWKAARPELEKALNNLGNAFKKATDEFSK